MKLEILSFEWKLFKSQNVISVNCMTKVWEITILDNHTSLITSLKPCVVSVLHIDENQNKTTSNFAVWSWVLEFSNNSMKILIDMLVWVQDLDIDLAKKAQKDAMETMEKYKNSKEKIDMEKFIEAQDLLLKSIAQLKLWNLK